MEIKGNKLSQDLSQYELLNSSLRSVIHNEYSTALWRNPNSESKHQIIDISGEIEPLKERIEDLGQAFLFASFNGDRKFAVRNHIHVRLTNDENTITLNSREYSSEKFFEGFQNKDLGIDYFINPKDKPANTLKDHYIDYINEGMELIEKGQFQKFVPARAKSITLDQDLDLAKLFLDLCEKYPNAFVSLVSIPGHGTWVGASPESLISVDKNGIFSTVSLAGTQPYKAGVELYDMPWTQKEIEEQAMVTRYIIDCFKKIRLREFDEHGPKTVKAGNLCHLRTDFVVNTIETNFKDLGSVMLELLHPTSAVCGMPMQQAFDFIKEKEGFDREFFSGFLGPVNIDGESRLFVNLRCMQLHGEYATLYAGAGVTAYSVPVNEWEETELKCRTMESIFSKDQ